MAAVSTVQTYYEWTLADVTDDDDHLTHTACRHDLDRALCGSDLTGATWVPNHAPEPDDCLVCETLEDEGGCSCPPAVVMAHVLRLRRFA